MERMLVVYHVSEEMAQSGTGFELSLRPVAEIFTSSDYNRIMNIVFLSFAIIMLLVAVLNYILLVVSSMVSRAKGIATYRCYGAGSGDIYRIIGGSDYFIPGSGAGVLGNVYTNYTDCWTEENPSQDVFWPRLSQSTNTNNNRASTFWKKNMSFLRLKTLEIGYSLPKNVVNKISAKSIRLFASGNNLFYISKFKFWDPELATSDGLKYPSMRSLMLGVEVNF